MEKLTFEKKKKKKLRKKNKSERDILSSSIIHLNPINDGKRNLIPLLLLNSAHWKQNGNIFYSLIFSVKGFIKKKLANTLNGIKDYKVSRPKTQWVIYRDIINTNTVILRPSTKSYISEYQNVIKWY